jgi:hypothetical protein
MKLGCRVQVAGYSQELLSALCLLLTGGQHVLT